MILLIDNYDSFTYNLYQYFAILGKEVSVVRNDKLNTSLVSRVRPEMIVISPGPGNPDSTGRCLSVIDAYVGKVPLLGICLGMQTIAQYFGARIVRAKEPVHGKNSSITHGGQGMFRGLPTSLSVTRYHSLVVDGSSIPKTLEVTAETEDGIVMGLRHREFLAEGVQFHPEAVLTDCGLEMLSNALSGRKE